MGGAEPPGPTRSVPSSGREHGEDGEHRTFTGVSTVAHWRCRGRAGHPTRRHRLLASYAAFLPRRADSYGATPRLGSWNSGSRSLLLLFRKSILHHNSHWSPLSQVHKMSGFQFVHCQQFSRKSVAATTSANGKTKGGRAGIRDVIAEASREPGACLHVDHPAPPVLVHGLDLVAMERLHDSRVEAGRSEVKGGKERKIRVDQATLLTVVASFPNTVEECAADAVKAAERDAWQARNIEWLSSEFGSDLISVVRHDDEKFPHLHAFVVPSDTAMKANPLHPGWSAKQSGKAEAVEAGMSTIDANKAGDRAYKAAMRAFQDGYWSSVGLPSGLTRIGPGRRRLDRGEWHAEQAAVSAAATVMTAATDAAAKRQQAFDGLRSDAARAVEMVAKARLAASAAVERADQAEAARAVALADLAKVERRAGSLVGQAKTQARDILREARRDVERLRGWGERFGSLWTGLTGVQTRLERRASEKVRAAEVKAAESIKAAKVEIRAEVADEVGKLKRDVERTAGAVEAAKAAVKAAKLETIQESAGRSRERFGRIEAERERDDFRGRWADADNRLQRAKPGIRT